MKPLLIELGSEELPAGYIRPALEGFSALLQQELAQNRIDHGPIRVYATPRRLALLIEEVAAHQRPLVTEVLGPPERIGLGADGKPTIAAQKFAEKIGVPMHRIVVKETSKGRYLCATKTEPGLSTKTVVARVLPQVIATIPFPKTMKWADLKILFARPLHSILALWGSQVISFRLGNITSGRYTFGHSRMKPVKIRLTDPADYPRVLEAAHVVVDMAQRKELLLEEIERTALEGGGRILPDDELVDTVVNLVEYPKAVLGRFDMKFLELPPEILITAMREHQKYFAVVNRENVLLPCFVAVNNTQARDMELVARGHERVLRARLEDARFFYKGDLSETMSARVEKLRGVLFQAELGSVYDKVQRLVRLVEFLGREIDVDDNTRSQLGRAALLCKADLVSQVVGEFPKLQGIMGRIYALAAGETETAASAIGEHYQPTHSGGALPRTLAGALLAVADKIDSICGCFRVGLIPTGASDPYALRRQGIGLVQILLAQRIGFSLTRLIQKSLSLFAGDPKEDPQQTLERVYIFLRDRIAHQLVEEGLAKDITAAVVSVSIEHVPNVWQRAHALQELKSQPGFEPLAVTFKRVVNIIRQAAGKDGCPVFSGVDESLFQDASENDLFGIYQEVRTKVEALLQQGDFNGALQQTATLRPAVDAFFDGVLVLAEDLRLRTNRLALLDEIAALFNLFADFSKIST